ATRPRDHSCPPGIPRHSVVPKLNDRSHPNRSPPMATMPLHSRDGHLFVEVDGELWVLDTGAPSSFAARGTVTFAGETFDVGRSFLGLDAAALSDFVGVECAGLLGADVLGRFDFILDAPAGTLEASTSDLKLAGVAIPLDEFMGIPIVS